MNQVQVGRCAAYICTIVTFYHNHQLDQSTIIPTMKPKLPFFNKAIG